GHEPDPAGPHGRAAPAGRDRRPAVARAAHAALRAGDPRVDRRGDPAGRRRAGDRGGAGGRIDDEPSVGAEPSRGRLSSRRSDSVVKAGQASIRTTVVDPPGRCTTVVDPPRTVHDGGRSAPNGPRRWLSRRDGPRRWSIRRDGPRRWSIRRDGPRRWSIRPGL